MKLESLLGVSPSSRVYLACRRSLKHQEKILYTSDPIAMHDILVKDHLSFEESDEFIV